MRRRFMEKASQPVGGGIYGVEWGRTESPVWTRTDDAVGFSDPVPYVAGMTAAQCSSPFDGIMPWAGMTRTTDAQAGAIVAIPKFYYKWSNDSSKMKLQISPNPQTGFLTSPAHLARNENETERDVVYVGRYHCTTTTYRSASGVKPQTNKTRSAFRTSIHNLGTKVWQWDHAMLWTICMLYLVEFANANSQAMIGYGCGDSSSEVTTGYTDSMPYHTGTTQSSKTTYGLGTQYRNIEGLWDNVLNWCDGIYFSGANVYHILDPSKFSDSLNGVLTGTRATTSSKFIKGFTFPSISNYEWAGYPTESDIDTVDTTGLKYFCDKAYYDSSGTVLYVGGFYDKYPAYGLFYRNATRGTSYTYQTVGSRLMKLP